MKFIEKRTLKSFDAIKKLAKKLSKVEDSGEMLSVFGALQQEINLFNGLKDLENSSELQDFQASNDQQFVSKIAQLEKERDKQINKNIALKQKLASLLSAFELSEEQDIENQTENIKSLEIEDPETLKAKQALDKVLTPSADENIEASATEEHLFQPDFESKQKSETTQNLESKVDQEIDQLQQEGVLQELEAKLGIGKKEPIQEIAPLTEENPTETKSENNPEPISSVENEVEQVSDFHQIDSENKETQSQEAQTIEETQEKSYVFSDPNPNLPEIKLSLNDRIAFINNLFDKDKFKFDAFVESLNFTSSREDAYFFIGESVKMHGWKAEQTEYVNRLKELVDLRFIHEH
ncbi:MAG: hypothetical protein C4K58_00690 [Flavobacteriaceae bacterium]|nr:MAG: hypothetical protein C4K58_00690 [Flavobacteriaceae bacterium]